MTQKPSTTTQDPPKGGRAVVGYICLALIVLMYVTPMIWDLVAWAIHGGIYLHSGRFHEISSYVSPAGSFGLLFGLFGVDRGLELLKKGQWAAFIIALICVMGAGIPTAPELHILSKALIHKGLAVVARPMFINLSLLTLVLLACKCRALVQFFRLMRPDLARLFKASPSRFIIASADETP